MVELVVLDADSPHATTTDPKMTISLFQQIIKSLPRRKIDRVVATHKSDKWCKKFSTFDQLIVMIFAQLSGQTSLRDLEASFNASPGRHHHLRSRGVKRSTLSDANATRPCGVFEAVLSMLLGEVSAKSGRKVGEMVEILAPPR